MCHERAPKAHAGIRANCSYPAELREVTNNRRRKMLRRCFNKPMSSHLETIGPAGYDSVTDHRGGGWMSESEVTLIWPIYFPADCPPAHAAPAGGVVFRFVQAGEPTADDFSDHWTAFPKRRDEFVRRGKTCDACGLSVYFTLEAAKEKRRIIPALRKLHIASGKITPPCGVILPTPEDQRDHFTWWPQPDGATYVAAFACIEGPLDP